MLEAYWGSAGASPARHYANLFNPALLRDRGAVGVAPWVVILLSSRNEISYPLGDIIEPVTCDDANFGGFVVPFRLPLSGSW